MGGFDEEGFGRLILLELIVVLIGGEILVFFGFIGCNRMNIEENFGVFMFKRFFVEWYGLIIERILVDFKNVMIYSRIYNFREENVKIYWYMYIILFIFKW